MKFTFGKYKGTVIGDNDDYPYLCMALQHRGWNCLQEEFSEIYRRTYELVGEMKDNRENIDLENRTSRPLHYGELTTILMRFQIMLEEEPDRYTLEEFIIQENFRRDIFPKTNT